MQGEPEVIRCEDCTRFVPIARSMVSDAGLVCDACGAARAATPPIVTPMWTRLRRAFGMARKN